MVWLRVALAGYFVMVFGCSKSFDDRDQPPTTAPMGTTRPIRKATVALFPVQINAQWGYIDRAGKIVISPRFDKAWSFSEGLARVQSGGDETAWGFINAKGLFVIPPKRIMVVPEFSEGLVMVYVQGNKGFMDRTGQVVIQPEYEGAFDFKESLAAVSVWKARLFRKGVLRHGYIDKRGKMVIAPRFWEAWPFSEGLAYVTIDGGEDGMSGKRGYINKTGEFVIPPKFDLALPFSDGLAAVEIDGKWGFIDKKGKFVIPAQFKNADGFSEELAQVKVGDKWGYVDKTGQIRIPPQFDTTRKFHEGMAAVGKDDATGESKWGYIDKSGDMKVEYQFDTAWRFENGLASVRLGEKRGYIDKAGQYVWKPTK